MTGMYNVLEKLRAGETLNRSEQQIHEQGLVSVLRQIHDELDAAVAEAYGWPVSLSDEEILERLVALNHERAEEERRGLVRWLRPEFQNPSGQQQTAIAVAEEEDAETDAPRGKKGARPAKTKSAKTKPQPWPKELSKQAAAVQAALAALSSGATAEEVARSFGRATKQRVELVEELLETLAALGKARRLDDERFVAA